MKTLLKKRILIGVLYVLAAGLLMTGVRPSAPAPTTSQFDSCTSILVGRLASADGSTMTSHSCDSGTDRTWMTIVPHLKHKPGEMCKVYFEPKRTKGPNDPDRLDAGEIPQVPETFAYLNAAYPIMNEHQLAIGETTIGGRIELKSDEGILDAPELYRLALERAQTARQAIQTIDELTKSFGYNDYGECFTFADPKEVWHFEIFGPGKGKKGAVWAAVRIPDDEIGMSANAGRIRQIELEDKDHFLASENVLSLARERGWWKPGKGEPFEFCYAYNPESRTSLYCRRREWRVLSLLAPSLKLDPQSENYPLSVKPEKKVTVRDLLAIFRDVYEGTEFDMTKDLTVVNKKGETAKKPCGVAVYERRLEGTLPYQARADDQLRGRHLSSDHPVPCLAPGCDRWRRLARLRQSRDDSTHALLLRDLEDARFIFCRRQVGLQSGLRLVGLPAGEQTGSLPLAGNDQRHRKGLEGDRRQGVRRSGKDGRAGASALKRGPFQSRKIPNRLLP